MGWRRRQHWLVWACLCLACSSGGTDADADGNSGSGGSGSTTGGSTGSEDGVTGSQPDPEPSGAPLECRSPCELAGSCAPEQEFPNQATTLETWLAQCGDASFLVSGICSDETPWIYRGGGYTTEVRYFDASGEFIGLGTSTDVLDETCEGDGYYPEPIRCSEPTVTEVHCGDSYSVGDSPNFPWAGD